MSPLGIRLCETLSGFVVIFPARNALSSVLKTAPSNSLVRWGAATPCLHDAAAIDSTSSSHEDTVQLRIKCLTNERSATDQVGSIGRPSSCAVSPMPRIGEYLFPCPYAAVVPLVSTVSAISVVVAARKHGYIYPMTEKHVLPDLFTVSALASPTL